MNDGAFGCDEKGAEGLAHQHDSENVRGKRQLDFGNVDVKGRNGVVAAAILWG